MEDNRYYSDRKFTVKRLGVLGGWKVVEMRVPLDRSYHKRKGDSDSVRFDSSVARARTAIRELALCNPWDWFVTLTLSKDKHGDRHDLDRYHERLTQYIGNLNKRREPSRKIHYILVPEMHRDGAWHMHGLLKGLDERDVVINEHGYYDWWPYRRNFGWISLGRIKSRLGVIGYICKYVSKSLAKELHKADAHMYYRSRGLIEPTVYWTDRVGWYHGRWDFKNSDIGLKLAYAQTDKYIELPEPGENDVIRELFELYAQEAAAPVAVPETPEALWTVLDGYAPISFDDL